MEKPLKVPTKESEYLATRGRRSKAKGIPFQYEGFEVERLKKALIELGYRPRGSDTDHHFRAETDGAVRRFQRWHKDLFVRGKRKPSLMPDGIVGPKTAVALNCALARAGKWFKDYKYDWIDKEGSHPIHCTSGSKTSITPTNEQDISWHCGGWKSISFLAIDGTASADADGFAKEMNKLRSVKGREGKRVNLLTQNIAQMLNEPEGANHPLSNYAQRSSKSKRTLAINLQSKDSPDERREVISSGSTAHSHALNLFTKAGILFDESFVRPDIFYCAMHASLIGGISFEPDRERARNHEFGDPMSLFKPSEDDKKIDWATVKWVILASCGSLSLHYRYFGIPGHGRGSSTTWAHRHYRSNKWPWSHKYVLSHYYPGLEWLRIIRRRAPQLHGLLGYWDKSPGGDVGGSKDKAIAVEFVKRLRKGETILTAWKQPGARSPQTKAWAAIVDEKYKDETLEDLVTNRLGDPNRRRRWMYASRYTGQEKERKERPIPIPFKEAFLEANSMRSYSQAAQVGKKKLGNFRLHRHYGWPLKKKKYYPKDLMEKRKFPEGKMTEKEILDAEKKKAKYLFDYPEGYNAEERVDREKEKYGVIKYPVGDIIESFAFRGSHFSALSVKEMKNLMHEAMGELTDDELKTTYRPVKVLLSGFEPWKGSEKEFHDYNSSQVIAQEMDGEIMEVETAIGRTLVYVSGIVLPVWWYDAADWLIEEVKLGYPDIVIGFGMKGSHDKRVEIETYGQNKNVKVKDGRKHACTPEEAIKRRPSWVNKIQKTNDPSKVRDDGPPELPKNLNSKVNIPHREIKTALDDTKGALKALIDYPTRRDSLGLKDPYAGTAGFYMCNQILYNLMYHNPVHLNLRLPSPKEKSPSIIPPFKYDVMTGFIHVPALRARKKLKKTAEKVVEECVKSYVERKMCSTNKHIPDARARMLVGSEWLLDIWG